MERSNKVLGAMTDLGRQGPPVSGRVDLHFHLLPGVDDGPSTMGESLELARMAVREGTGTIVATPHVRDVDLHELPERLAELQTELELAGIGLKVLPGGELAPEDLNGIGESDLSLISQGPSGNRWLLLEAPLHGGSADEFRIAAANIRSTGLEILIAHPERSEALGRGFDQLVTELVAAGAMLQVSGESVLGAYGEHVSRSAMRLLKGGRAILASDAHGASRPPTLATAGSAAGDAGLSRREVHFITTLGPRLLIERGIPHPTAADGI